jgi:hypothetical protein
MTNSKIHKDEVDWLIAVYKTSDDDELKNESLEKLLNYGLDENQINERFKNLKSEDDELKAFKKAWEKQKERNQFEKYSFIEKLKIFLFGPYELFKFFSSGLTDLKKENYKIKFRQRLVLLIAGTFFWIVFGIATYQYYEYKRIQEIENVDTTYWENNRIKNE